MESIGWKNIPERFISYPFMGPLHFAEKRDLLIPHASKENAEQLRSYIENNRIKYRQFIRQKSRYPTIDPYACFQPFNEAFKALYNFIGYIQKQLQPGDIVLNLWDRSGWTATMLAGWFPDQKIWTIWEGDKDILGYKGYDHWIAGEERNQHTVIFADFERPLPIESASVGAVIGFDLLHRFNQPDILFEINRVAKPGAPVIFPHVHLTNNFPDPFFERGCRQLHGRDYEAMFNTLAPLTNRAGYILSEPWAFHNNDSGPNTTQTLISTPDHNDYNACIAWLDQDSKPFIQPWRGYFFNWKKHYLLQNPFVIINARNEIEWNRKLYEDNIEELLERHNVYRKRITPLIGKKIPEKWTAILYWAAEGKTLEEIAGLTATDEKEMQSFLEESWKLDLAQSLPIDEAGFRLQILLSNQKYIPGKKEQNLNTYWKQMALLHEDQTWIKTPETILNFAQGNELIELTKKALAAEGLKAYDKLIICTNLHYETLILFWAAVSMGIIVVPISAKESEGSIKNHIERIQPAFVFADPAVFKFLKYNNSIKVFMADIQDDDAYDESYSFEALLSKHVDNEVQLVYDPEPNDFAVILSTSGSTGNPKLIPLTHAQLIRSGRIMTETYHWKKSDIFLGLGGLETMSGLRNATVCIAETGTTLMIPSRVSSAREFAEIINEEQITIIAANPAFFHQLLLAAKSRNTAKAFHSVRLALCTGNNLTASLRDEWALNANSSINNYYGLTETSGICIAEPPGFSSDQEKNIGVPIGCLVKITNADGNPVQKGEEGELNIYGAGNFHGYYQNENATRIVLKDGWFSTGDLAIFNQDGSITLRGRISDLIKLPSGERLEISALDEAISLLKEITDWAVCPIHEGEKESFAVAFISPEHSDENEIKKSIKNIITEKIGGFALPKIISSVDHIPRGNHNKVLRKQLTDQLLNNNIHV